MRIIDKRKDYYDYMQRYGLDPAVTYERKYDEFDVASEFSVIAEKYTVQERATITNEISALQKEEFRIPVGGISIFQNYFVICGKSYLNFTVTIPTKNYDFFTNWGDSEYFCSDFKEVVSLLKKKLTKSKFQQLEESLRTDSYFSHTNHWKYLSELSKNLHALPAITKFVNSPVYRLSMGPRREIHVEINPILKDFHFGKVIPAEEIFQQISSWLSCRKDVPMVTISDKDMRDKKGFNNCSFKTRSSKKKKRSYNKC